MKNTFDLLYAQEWGNYKNHSGDIQCKWYHLERLHILSQLSFPKHLHIHGTMFYEALREKNTKECFGQIIRLLLVPLGHLSSKLPRGNIGTSRAGVFQSMEIPEEFRPLFSIE